MNKPNLIKQLKSLSLFIAGALAYQAWYDRYKSKQEAKVVSERIEVIEREVTNMNENIAKCIDPNLKSKLIENQSNLNEELSNLRKIHEDYVAKFNPVAPEDESIKVFEDYNDDFKKFEKLSDKAEKIDKLLEDSDKKKFMDNSIIWDKINEYKEFLSNLSLTDICLVINISMSIFIFTCLVSILFAFYGNFLIDKLSLENKYPKISRIIRARVKLQHYYIIMNTILIILGLISLIYINTITFIHG